MRLRALMGGRVYHADFDPPYWQTYICESTGAFEEFFFDQFERRIKARM